MGVGEAEVRTSGVPVLERKRNCRGDTALTVDTGRSVAGGKRGPGGNLVSGIGRWAEACFPVGSKTNEADLRELLKEAADAAKDDYGPESAVAWADGYTFPPEYVTNDVACLEASHGDFEAMVRQRLKGMAPGRLNADRVSRLRLDNPELTLLKDLVGGMKVHLPEGFKTNGMMRLWSSAWLFCYH
jgi:hypothetical protein